MRTIALAFGLSVVGTAAQAAADPLELAASSVVLFKATQRYCNYPTRVRDAVSQVDSYYSKVMPSQWAYLKSQGLGEPSAVAMLGRMATMRDQPNNLDERDGKCSGIGYFVGIGLRGIETAADIDESAWPGISALTNGDARARNQSDNE